MGEPAGTNARPWLVMGLVALPVFLATVNFSVMFVAFDTITDHFDASDAAVSWTLTGYTITAGSLIIPAGWFADRYGRKRALLLGMSVFVVGSALIAAAPTLVVFIAGRLVQAAGLSLQSIAALAVVMDVFGPERRSTAVGGLGGIGGVAAATGPLIGGLLLDGVGWRWTFFANVPAGIVLILLLFFGLEVKETTNPSSERPDLIGIATLIAGASLFALAVVQSNSWGFTSIETIGVAIAGLAALVAVVQRSRDRSNAILFLPLFRDRTFRLGSFLNLIVAGSFAGLYLAWVNMLDEDGWGYTKRDVGLALSAIPLVAGPLSIAAGRWADRLGHRRIILTGTVMLGLSGVIGLNILDGTASVWSWVVFAVIYGIGVGLGHSASHAAAMVNVPAERLGVGGAMSRIAMDVGGTFSVALVVAMTLAASTQEVATERVLQMLVVVGVVGSVAAAALGDTRR